MIIKFLAVFLIVYFLIFIHEFGHYLAAIRNGVKVEEFSIGFPPRLLSFKKFGTKFSFALLPLGGFVKLHGDNFESDTKVNESKAFYSKTPWAKIKILFAGPLMNFLVYIVLMTLAFTFGVSRNFSSYSDLITSVNDGNVTIERGLNVKLIEDFSTADQALKVDTTVDFIEDKFVISNTSYEFTSLKELSDFGIILEDFIEVPTLKVLKDANFLKKNDEIIQVNNQYFYDFDSFLSLINENSRDDLKISFIRDDVLTSLTYDTVEGYYVSDVVDGSSADTQNVQVGSIFTKIEGVGVKSIENISKYVNDSERNQLMYSFSELEEFTTKDFELKPNDQGVTGLVLSPVFNYLDFNTSFTIDNEIFTIKSVSEIKYGFINSLFNSVVKGSELTWDIMKSFVSTIFNFFASFEVSDSVGGPVAVFKMSYDYVSLGGTQLMQFIALISLTLASINLIPIPVLDGGRIFIVVIEALRGKLISNKTISIISLLSFGLLLVFILFVSFFDIIRL